MGRLCQLPGGNALEKQVDGSQRVQLSYPPLTAFLPVGRPTASNSFSTDFCPAGMQSCTPFPPMEERRAN